MHTHIELPLPLQVQDIILKLIMKHGRIRVCWVLEPVGSVDGVRLPLFLVVRR